MLSYEAFCRSAQLEPYPVTFTSLGRFCCLHVINNRGSTKSLRGAISAIKTECLHTRKAYLDDTDQMALSKLIGRLIFNELSEGRRKRPLQLQHLARITRKLDLSKDPDLLLALMLYGGHDGLLRGGELLSGILVCDVLWGQWEKFFGSSDSRTKTHRSGEALLIPYTDIGGLNFVSLLRKWFQRHNLEDRPTSPIFPAFTRGRKLNFSKTVSAASLRYRIRKAAILIGLNPRHYSNHSLRVGGATDLFVARAPYFIIKKMGRWKSDAALLYYRDEEDVRVAVAEAFSRMDTMG